MSDADGQDGSTAFKPRHLASAAGWLAAAQGLSLCLKLALVPVLTRLLTPAEYGAVAACMALILFVTMVGGSGGWSAALVVLGQKNFLAWRSAFSATLAVSVLFAAALWVFAPGVSGLMGIGQADHLLRGLALLIPIMIGTEFLSTYLVASDRFRADARISLVAEIAAAIAGVSAALAGWGAWALVLQQFVAQGLRLCLLLSVSRLLPTVSPNVSLIAPLTPYAAKAVLAELVNFVGVQGPTIVVTRALGAAGTGLYGVSNRVTSLPGDIVMQSLARILVPAFVALDNPAERSKAVIWSGAANSLSLCPVRLGVAALSEPFCRFAFGQAFAGAYTVLAGLAIGKAITAPCAGYYSYLKAADRVGLLTFLMGARSVLIVVGTAVGLALDGLNGAGWGFAAAALPTLALYSASVFRIAGIPWFEGVRPVAWTLFNAALMSGLVFAFVQWAERVQLPDLLTVLVSVSCGGILYLGLTLATSRVAFGVDISRYLALLERVRMWDRRG